MSKLLRKMNGLGKAASSPAPEEFLSLLIAYPQIDHCYDSLVGNLHRLSRTRPLKTVMITSTQPEEGKTTVALSLAIKTALGGKATLMIDADCRKPRIHKILALENEGGLSKVATGQISLLDCIQRIDIPHSTKNLSVMTSGRGPFNLLSGDGPNKLRVVIEEVKDHYDMVYIDTPPVLAVGDAMLLAPLVDGIVLVLNTGTVSERDTKLAKVRLEEAGGHILGVVMNCFKESLHGATFNPYYQYYAGKTSG